MSGCCSVNRWSHRQSIDSQNSNLWFFCRFGDFSETFTFIFWSTVFSPPLLLPHPHYVIYLCVIAFHLSSFLLSLEMFFSLIVVCFSALSCTKPLNPIELSAHLQVC